MTCSNQEYVIRGVNDVILFFNSYANTLRNEKQKGNSPFFHKYIPVQTIIMFSIICIQSRIRDVINQIHFEQMLFKNFHGVIYPERD